MPEAAPTTTLTGSAGGTPAPFVGVGRGLPTLILADHVGGEAASFTTRQSGDRSIDDTEPVSKRGTTIAAVVGCCFVLGAATAFAAVERIDGPATVASSADRLSSPRPGNPGGVPLPPEAAPADTSHPDRVIGSGTPASCTSQAVVAAVAAGGVITFNCGPDPVTIVMTATAKVVNTAPVVVLDGGGKVTLSGAGQRRILYMNTCDPAQIWTTSHCQNQDHPSLTIQNLHFTQGNSTGETYEGGGGGAVFVRGGRMKVIDSFFTANRCDATGPDLGGAALRVLEPVRRPARDRGREHLRR